MTLDLTKLTPAPWRFLKEPRGCSVLGWVQPPGEEEVAAISGVGGVENGEFIALARNAFDVQERRHWVVTKENIWGDPERKYREVYIVREQQTLDLKDDGNAYRKVIGRIVGPLGNELIWADDPYSVLVRCDEWHKANVEAQS